MRPGMRVKVTYCSCREVITKYLKGKEIFAADIVCKTFAERAGFIIGEDPVPIGRPPAVEELRVDPELLAVLLEEANGIEARELRKEIIEVDLQIEKLWRSRCELRDRLRAIKGLPARIPRTPPELLEGSKRVRLSNLFRPTGRTQARSQGVES